MKILVCGGRDFDMAGYLYDNLNAIDRMIRVTCVVHGDAKGADKIAGGWAATNNIPQLPYPADWDKHGRAAGPIRNRLMLQENPDIMLVVAFKGGAGTRNMVSEAKKKGIKVMEIK